MNVLLLLLFNLSLVQGETIGAGGANTGAASTQPSAQPPNTRPSKRPPRAAEDAQSDPAAAPNPAATGIPPIYAHPPQQAVTPAAKPPSKKKQRELERKRLEERALELKIKSWTAGGPTPNTDWDKYEYPKNYRGWSSGDVGLGNIGNGLCTAKNAERAQMKLGYCQMLTEILKEEGSCANTAMKAILPAANQGRFGDLHLYCSNWHSLKEDEKIQAFVQVLAGLITKESGWNPAAKEQPWVRQDGHHMGGMGLFQIGVEDRVKDKDCAALTATTIFDPKTNMRCGSCIALKHAARDFTMGHGTGDRASRGIASYFSPFRDHHENPPANKRPEIQMATQTFCRPNKATDK